MLCQLITIKLVGKKKINLNNGAYIKNKQKEFMGKEERENARKGERLGAHFNLC